MPEKLVWTPAQDAAIQRARNAGATWDAISNAFGLSRNAIIERARRIGCSARPPPALLPREPDEDREREPMPAGHRISWGAINAGTWLDGVAFVPA